MTIDKITHYIGEDLVNHISSLDATQLAKMKIDIENDLKHIKHDSQTLFKRNLERRFINYRLLIDDNF